MMPSPAVSIAKFSACVRETLTLLATTVPELASKTGISVLRLEDIRSGKNLPSPAEFDALNRALEFQLDRWTGKLYGVAGDSLPAESAPSRQRALEIRPSSSSDTPSEAEATRRFPPSKRVMKKAVKRRDTKA